MIGAMALSLLVAVITWRLWRASLRVPIFPAQGDASWTLTTIKGIIDHGWYESNPTLGAPFGQLSYDFPAYVGDFGKVVMVKALALISTNPAVVVNMALLVGFPLIALATFLVLRRLCLSRGVALVCAVLFATSPIHFFLAPVQAWLANYIAVPFSGYLILAILGEKSLFTRREAAGPRLTAWLSTNTAITIGMCLLVGCLGLDYAEFTCLLVGISGAMIFVIRRHARALVSSVVVIAAITIPVLASAAPDLAYRNSHGTNPVVAHRVPVDSFEYGLQPIQLVLPQLDDRIAPFAHFAARIDTDLERGGPGVPINLGPQISLGLLSALGLIWLLWVVIGGALGRLRKDSLAGQAGVAALLCTLLAMTSGGSVLFSYLVTAQLRVWARISILIAFLAVVGLALLLERARDLLRGRTHGRWLSITVLLAALFFGVFEGTTNRFVPAYGQLTSTWHNDARFVAQVQHSLPPNAMVLELPYVPYPEARLPTGLTSYEPLVPSLHSTTLRWSAGAMEGRPTDWLASWANQPLDRLLRGAVAAGFGGVYVLRAGYSDHGASIAASIQALTGAPPLTDTDGSAVFFNLLSYAERLRATISRTEFLAMGTATIYPLTLKYGGGFYEAELSAGMPRWGGQDDIIAIDNPSRTAQSAKYSTIITTGYPTPSRVSIMWPDGTSTSVAVSDRGYVLARSLTLPPGHSAIRLTTNAPRVRAPSDPRALYLQFMKSTLTTAAGTHY